jgi:tetratricopeptide (TPR) repeat protein
MTRKSLLKNFFYILLLTTIENVLAQDSLYTNIVGKGIYKYNNLEYSDAILEFNSAIKLNPYQPISYYYRGKARQELNDFQGSMKDFNTAIKLNPDDYENYKGRAYLKFIQDDNRGAILDYNKAFSLSVEKGFINTSFYIERGIAYSKIGECQKALSDFDKAIEINSNNAAAYYNRGITKWKIGDLNSACYDWSKAGELGSSQAYENIKRLCK